MFPGGISLTLAIFFAFFAAFFLQVLTFVPSLGIGWAYRFELKRWILRIIALSFTFLWLMENDWSNWDLIPLFFLTFFFIVSFVGYNPRIFQDLDEGHLESTISEGLDPETEVFGIEISGSARAYPVADIVVPRHLLNDRINGMPVLISYCAACRSAIAYDPVIDGRRLTFQVVAVWRRNMVIRDRQTGTIWQQATGEAIYGPLKGNRMEILSAQQMQLAEWMKLYPASVVVSEKATAPKGRIPKKRLMKMLKITNKRLSIGFVSPGNQVDSREKVFGLEQDGFNKAYTVSGLKKNPRFRDKIGTTEIEVNYDPDSNKIEIRRIADGKLLPAQIHWWMGWKEFHPETEVM